MDEERRNPLEMPADVATRVCGPLDPTARVPEPAHYDCRECHKRIRDLLAERVHPAPRARAPRQITGPWMKPEEEQW